MVKPPPVPMPGIGGGGMTMINAPSMGASRLRKSLVMTAAVNPFFNRTSGSSNTGNSAAALLAWVRVAPDRPAKAATRMMPGVSRAILSICRTIAVVRASDAAPGSWADTMT
jgi:hypothetical protein